MTAAVNGRGVPELAAAIAWHRDHLTASGGLAARRRSRLRLELLAAAEKAWRAAGARLAGSPFLEDLLDRVSGGALPPRQAASELVDRLAGELGPDHPGPG